VGNLVRIEDKKIFWFKKHTSLPTAMPALIEIANSEVVGLAPDYKPDIVVPFEEKMAKFLAPKKCC
jgi:hypothetical protein